MLSLLVENVKKLSGEGSIILSSKLNVQEPIYDKNSYKIKKYYCDVRLIRHSLSNGISYSLEVGSSSFILNSKLITKIDLSTTELTNSSIEDHTSNSTSILTNSSNFPLGSKGYKLNLFILNKNIHKKIKKKKNEADDSYKNSSIRAKVKSTTLSSSIYEELNYLYYSNYYSDYLSELSKSPSSDEDEEERDFKERNFSKQKEFHDNDEIETGLNEVNIESCQGENFSKKKKDSSTSPGIPSTKTSFNSTDTNEFNLFIEEYNYINKLMLTLCFEDFEQSSQWQEVLSLCITELLYYESLELIYKESYQLESKFKNYLEIKQNYLLNLKKNSFSSSTKNNSLFYNNNKAKEKEKTIDSPLSSPSNPLYSSLSSSLSYPSFDHSQENIKFSLNSNLLNFQDHPLINYSSNICLQIELLRYCLLRAQNLKHLLDIPSKIELKNNELFHFLQPNSYNISTSFITSQSNNNSPSSYSTYENFSPISPAGPNSSKYISNSHEQRYYLNQLNPNVHHIISILNSYIKFIKYFLEVKEEILNFFLVFKFANINTIHNQESSFQTSPITSMFNKEKKKKRKKDKLNSLYLNQIQFSYYFNNLKNFITTKRRRDNIVASNFPKNSSFNEFWQPFIEIGVNSYLQDKSISMSTLLNAYNLTSSPTTFLSSLSKSSTPTYGYHSPNSSGTSPSSTCTFCLSPNDLVQQELNEESISESQFHQIFSSSPSTCLCSLKNFSQVFDLSLNQYSLIKNILKGDNDLFFFEIINLAYNNNNSPFSNELWNNLMHNLSKSINLNPPIVCNMINSTNEFYIRRLTRSSNISPISLIKNEEDDSKNINSLQFNLTLEKKMLKFRENQKKNKIKEKNSSWFSFFTCLKYSDDEKESNYCEVDDLEEETDESEVSKKKKENLELINPNKNFDKVKPNSKEEFRNLDSDENMKGYENSSKHLSNSIVKNTKSKIIYINQKQFDQQSLEKEILEDIKNDEKSQIIENQTINSNLANITNSLTSTKSCKNTSSSKNTHISEELKVNSNKPINASLSLKKIDDSNYININNNFSDSNSNSILSFIKSFFTKSKKNSYQKEDSHNDTTILTQASPTISSSITTPQSYSESTKNSIHFRKSIHHATKGIGSNIYLQIKPDYDHDEEEEDEEEDEEYEEEENKAFGEMKKVNRISNNNTKKIINNKLSAKNTESVGEEIEVRSDTLTDRLYLNKPNLEVFDLEINFDENDENDLVDESDEQISEEEDDNIELANDQEAEEIMKKNKFKIIKQRKKQKRVTLNQIKENVFIIMNNKIKKVLTLIIFNFVEYFSSYSLQFFMNFFINFIINYFNNTYSAISSLFTSYEKIEYKKVSRFLLSLLFAGVFISISIFLINKSFDYLIKYI